MRILEDRKAGIFTLIPLNFGERMLIDKLLAKATRRLKFMYNGHAKGSTAEANILQFNVGGTHYRKALFLNGKRCGSTGGFKGGTTFRVRASDEESRHALGGIRDMCFFASGGLIFLREDRVAGARSLVCTGNFCKICESPIIGVSAESENRICDQCADTRCEHEYRQTVLLTPAFGLIETESCAKCKRMSPSAVARAKQTPKLQRVAEAQAHMREQLPNTHCFVGRPGDMLSMTVDEAVLVRDRNAIPLRYLQMISETVAGEDMPEALKIFDDIAKDFRERT